MLIYVLSNGFSTVCILETVKHIYSRIGAFLSLYFIKFIGDWAFKKESLGGGDIKLMFLFGLVIGFPMAICTIFFVLFSMIIYFATFVLVVLFIMFILLNNCSHDIYPLPY